MKYPIGIQTFEKIIRGGFVYVDKTRFVYDLAQKGGFYFLSRPRRFGKSLLLSTIEAYFLGKKELFSGLAIEGLETEWKAYPVLRLDFAAGNYTVEEAIISKIEYHLSKWEKEFGVTTTERTLSDRFSSLIDQIYNITGKQVVVLIDEYDKPLLDTIGMPDLQAKNRATLKAFYTVLKSQDQYIRFAMLTGVTKFSKVTVFSGLNNLNDITTQAQYAEVCGITEEELHAYFAEPIRDFAQTEGLDVDEMYRILQKKYDGYHFVPRAKGVYNPFSLLQALQRRELGDYWFESGTPTYLVEVLKKTDYLLPNLQQAKITQDLLGDIDTVDRTPLPLLYQAGYLTIADYDSRFKRYTLDFPNEEVSQGFWAFLLPLYIHSRQDIGEFAIANFVDEVEQGKAEKFMKRMQAMFNDTSYRLVGDAEKYIQNVIYLLFRLMGFYVKAEYEFCDGRIDMIVETPLFIYIMEMKYDKDAEQALNQIKEKDYAKIYINDPRQLFKIGINFNSATRTIDEFIIE